MHLSDFQLGVTVMTRLVVLRLTCGPHEERLLCKRYLSTCRTVSLEIDSSILLLLLLLRLHHGTSRQIYAADSDSFTLIVATQLLPRT
jgi:hypothetical protein